MTLAVEMRYGARMGIPVSGSDPVAELMRFAHRVAGIELGEGKRSQVEGRLLPRLAAAPRRRVRIWCAAAAGGEEPYSIALCLRRSLPPAPPAWDASVLATDLSTRSLGRVSDGLYTEDRVAHLTVADRRLALDLVQPGPPKVWQVKPELKRLVSLARLNLLDETWPMRGPFDAIFCCHVMVYYDRPTRERLVGRFAKMLAPGGTLYLGQRESLAGISHPLTALAPAVLLKA